MKLPTEIIKALIESRAECDRLYIRARPADEGEAARLRVLFDRTRELSRDIDRMIDKEIDASLHQMQAWIAELAPITAHLREIQANIDGIVTAAGLIGQVLKIAVAIVGLILAV
ncbi:hypothetical protein OV079_50450 [Nannocystis pusilla]|uniref:Uncharacterized protein n=1 Tax=Nannocystis pusilla TaxID=889268 RepID=A0A9X3J485_9BACT|nr:hypothetical protein [Nannocystis pusilla]MCY1013619.1 hypothetical protein [Nannocystis pusilla]